MFLSLKIVFIFANSADPDEMPYYAAFHLGLHYLPNICSPLSRVKQVLEECLRVNLFYSAFSATQYNQYTVCSAVSSHLKCNFSVLTSTSCNFCRKPSTDTEGFWEPKVWTARRNSLISFCWVCSNFCLSWNYQYLYLKFFSLIPVTSHNN